MNAYARDLSHVAAGVPARRPAPLGATLVAPSEITYHTVLSSLATGGDVSFADSTLPEGTTIPVHVHPDEDQIVIVLAGSVEVEAAGRTLARSAGQTAFVPRGAPHGIRALTEARLATILTRTRLDARHPG